MLALKIAGTIAGIGLGTWVGFKLVGIGIDWLKFGMKHIRPPRKED